MSLSVLSSVSCSASDTSNGATENNSQLIRRTALPLYSEVPEYVEKSIEEKANPTVLEVVKNFRKEACKLSQMINSVASRCEHIVNTGIAHTYGSYINTVDYLRDENNFLPRVGAISGGLFFGYLISFRKGFLRRIIYAAAFGGITAGICYPAEATVYADKSVQSSKKYATIGYHFLNGVTNDLAGFELPKFPLKLLSSDSQETAKKDD